MARKQKQRQQQRRAWGHIGKVIDGKKYILRWTQNTPDGRGRPCETFYGTWKQANARMSELEVLYGKSKPVPTIGSACKMWYLPWLEKRLDNGKIKQETANKYKKVLYSNVLPMWGNTPVTEVKPVTVQNWLNTMSSYDAKLSLIVAKSIVDHAVKYDVVASNKFAIGYELPSKKTSKSKSVFDLSRANAAFETLHGARCEPAFILQLFGSARVGESLAVKRNEVTETECKGIKFAIVPIIRRVSHDDELMPDGDLKTENSARDIVIPEPYGTRLLEIASAGIVPDSEWLCPSFEGSYMKYSAFVRLWNDESCDYRIPPSNLRISWRTIAQYEWGIDYDTCEILMGHKLKGVTGAHYLKPSTNQIIEKIADALSQN